MEDGYDVNFICGDFIKHSERKAPDNYASERPVNNRIQVRIENDSRQRVVDTFHKLQIQILALMSVPTTGLGEFGVGFGSEPSDHLGLA